MMGHERLIERMREAGWTNPGMINKQSLEWDAATAISALEGENDRLRAELQAAREDNMKLCGTMMGIARTDDHAMNQLVFRISYNELLSHDAVMDVAEIFLRTLLEVRQDAKDTL